MNGKFCCRSNKEDVNQEKYGDLCDGSKIEIDSVCCDQDDYIKCSHDKCNNNEDLIEDKSGSVFGLWSLMPLTKL